MKYLLIALAALVAFAATSCEELTDLDDPASVKKAKDRSEYILMCTPKEEGGKLVYTLKQVLHKKPGVSVPWGIGDLVSAPMLEATKSDQIPDAAVIFYENFAGATKPIELQLFYTTSSESDASRLEKLLEALKQ